MSRRIDQDLKRFRQIVRGKVRKNLSRYITHGEMIGRKGREAVSIPVPDIEIPRFVHGRSGSGGVGQGDGEVGQPIGRGPGDEAGSGAAGNEPGRHIREVEVTLDDLADVLGEELELPRIEPKGADTLQSHKDRYTTIRRTGPDSLRHFRRTWKEALKRQLASRDYDPDNPVIIPLRDDNRYRSWKSVPQRQANAAVIYLMDVSGSMGAEQKEIVRTTAFWIDTWLKRQYGGIQRRFLVHDAAAKEVDEQTFYSIRESGGTQISSVYREAQRLVERSFPADAWNIYFFQFSDGDNWAGDDEPALEILKSSLLPVANLFCYGQVVSPFGSGGFLQHMEALEEDCDKLVGCVIEDKDSILSSIRLFLGTGR